MRKKIFVAGEQSFQTSSTDGGSGATGKEASCYADSCTKAPGERTANLQALGSTFHPPQLYPSRNQFQFEVKQCLRNEIFTRVIATGLVLLWHHPKTSKKATANIGNDSSAEKRRNFATFEAAARKLLMVAVLRPSRCRCWLKNP